MTDQQLIVLAELQRDSVGTLAFRQSDREFAERMSLRLSGTPHMADAGDDDCLTPEEAAEQAFGVVCSSPLQVAETEELDMLYYNERG